MGYFHHITAAQPRKRRRFDFSSSTLEEGETTIVRISAVCTAEVPGASGLPLYVWRASLPHHDHLVSGGPGLSQIWSEQKVPIVSFFTSR